MGSGRKVSRHADVRRPGQSHLIGEWPELSSALSVSSTSSESFVPVHDRLAAIPGVAQGPGYSHAVITSGRLAFIAGQIGVDTDGQLVGPGDLAAQTRQALQNLQNVLGAVGADWSDVVRLGWYVTDIANLQTIRDIRDEFLRPALGDQPNPASTLIQVASLFRPELLVEVEAVVALPG
jgi:enamine deaminase RidA (YjgF/YER057c/UK114 family)